MNSDIRCIHTPLGDVGLLLDDAPCATDGIWEVVAASDYEHRHPADGNWSIVYWHEPDGVAHTLECKLVSECVCKGGSTSGERLEATEIENGQPTLVIAVEYDSDDCAHGHGEYEYDYIATAVDCAVTIELPTSAKAQWIVFGVSWVEGLDEENRMNPWLVGNPNGNRLRIAPRGWRGNVPMLLMRFLPSPHEILSQHVFTDGKQNDLGQEVRRVGYVLRYVRRIWIEVRAKVRYYLSEGNPHIWLNELSLCHRLASRHTFAL